MNVTSIDINPLTGDVSYLFKRDIPTADGLINHRGLLVAGDTESLEKGIKYSDDAVSSENPKIKIAEFPDHIKKLITGMWNNTHVKKVISQREDQRKAEIEAAEKLEKANKKIAEEKEKANKKEFDDAVAAAVAKALKK